MQAHHRSIHMQLSQEVWLTTALLGMNVRVHGDVDKQLLYICKVCNYAVWLLLATALPGRNEIV